MGVKLGVLLPTRERVMAGQPDVAPLLALAERAEALGYDSLWAGDSLLARPRHEPLALLAAVAARTRRAAVGTAILLPALRHPVLLAHQAATVDRIAEGRLILGVGIASDAASVRAEFAAAGVPFEKRAGRMAESLRLCRALWRGRPVDWDGRWTLAGDRLEFVPHRSGGPPVWGGGTVPAARRRAARWFDGWMPTGPDAEGWGAEWREVREAAEAAGRDPSAITGAAYLTVAIGDDPAAAAARTDDYLERYYGHPAALLRRRQACFGGPAEAAAEWLAGYAAAGARHLVLRFVGDHERQLEFVAGLRAAIG